MPYIIDGNNLIGSSPDISLGDPESRLKLISLLKRFQESRNIKIVLVFDGDPGGGAHKQTFSPKFSIIFPLEGFSADDEIKRILKSYSQPQDTILVTSDSELKRFAKEMGTKTKNSIEFYYELKKSQYQLGKKEEAQRRIHTELSKGEVDKWLKIFDKNH